jgi:glycosyltransferase involved in cell wall biosynthesis
MSAQDIILSVLTPAVPSRWEQLRDLMGELCRQIGDRPVEHLVFVDNKRRTVGEKRDALLRASRGRYVAFCDDDDWVAPNYIDRILAGIATGAAVVTFRQEASVDDLVSTVEFKLANDNGPFIPGGVTKRSAWHICAWRRDYAIQSKFPATNYGEDWSWAESLCRMKCLEEHHIPEVLHYYRHSSKHTEAPPLS